MTKSVRSGGWNLFTGFVLNGAAAENGKHTQVKFSKASTGVGKMGSKPPVETLF